MSDDIRYYRGGVPLIIIEKHRRKALIRYKGRGYVGPKKLRKFVRIDDTDIVLIRHCWRNPR